MLRSNSKNLRNHVVSPEEEKERLQWEGFGEKEGFSDQKLHAAVDAYVADEMQALSRDAA